MANSEQVERLRSLGSDWNKWRRDHSSDTPDLRDADLTEAFLHDCDLSGADMRGAKICRARFIKCSFVSAMLSGADATGAHFHESNFTDVVAEGFQADGCDFSHCQLNGARFVGAVPDPSEKSSSSVCITGFGTRTIPACKHSSFREASFNNCVFDGALLDYADFYGTRVFESSFKGASLRGATFVPRSAIKVSMSGANLQGAELSGADLSGIDLAGACLRSATLIDARLGPGRVTQVQHVPSDEAGPPVHQVTAHQYDSSLRGADLRDADLTGAMLLQADLSNADLRGARVYGTSTWKLKLDGAKQAGLVVSRCDEPMLTVDDLEIAQFVYLLVEHRNIRRAIDVLTSKVVLILGSFSETCKPILDALAGAIRERDLIPVVFDFEKPANRSMTETVETLALLARFVIVDLTDPRCSPHEVMSFVASTVVVTQPIIAAPQEPYAMFGDLQRAYHWVLPVVAYSSQDELLAMLDEAVLKPCEVKVKSLRAT